MSVIWRIEHFIVLGMPFEIVSDLTNLCSRASATVKVLKLIPVHNPFVILLLHFSSLIVDLRLILKFGKETKDKISPLFTFINNAAPPVALNVSMALFGLLVN